MASDRLADWALVAAIAIAFLVIPAIVVYRPPVLPFRVSFIILPLLPAVGLALIAVWFAVRRERR